MPVPAPVLAWTQHVMETARTQPVEPSLLLAFVWQESAGRADAFRHEPAFWDRYLKGKPEWTRGYTHPVLDTWRRRVSSSYGLLQIMPATAAWMGWPADSDPEMLFRPSVNLYYGAKLIRHIQKSAADERAIALRWNGGGRPAYADELLSKLTTLRKET